MIDGEKLKKILFDREMSVVDLGKLMGMNYIPAYLYRLIDGQHEARMAALERIAVALGVAPRLIAQDRLLELLEPPPVGRVAEGRAEYVSVVPVLDVPIVGRVETGIVHAPPFPAGGYAAAAEAEHIAIAIDDPAAYALRTEDETLPPPIGGGAVVIITPGSAWQRRCYMIVRLSSNVCEMRIVTLAGDMLVMESPLPGGGLVLAGFNDVQYYHKIGMVIINSIT